VHWHVEGSYNPSDRGSSKSGNHLVLDVPLRAGRLVRDKGDPLCKPKGKFWGLTGPDRNRGEPRVIDCHACVQQALRLGFNFDAAQSLDLGRSWSAKLVIEQGRPRRVMLRSRWFMQPPVQPPEPPSEQSLLRAVQAIAPSVRAVRIDRMEPAGFNEVAGMALVESAEEGGP
jgi:hypothetical protein